MGETTQPIWVDEPGALADLVERLTHAGRVGLDTEFHGERSFYPQLMLVQLATEDAIYLIDPLAELDLKPLFEVLARPQPLVIGHALHNDLEIVFLRYGLLLEGVFDTQIAGSFLGHGLQAGLSNLLRAVLHVRLAKDGQMGDWSRRPLPRRQLSYAADDVRHLLALHDNMQADLQQRGRAGWAAEECAALFAEGRYGRDPMQAWRRVSGARGLKPREAGILVELAAERDRMAAELDRVVHHVLSDDLLIALCRAAPRDHNALHGDRRFRNRTLHRYADRLVAAVVRGSEQPLERPRGRKPPSPGVEAAAALIMMVVGELADREDLAPPLLLRRKDLQRALADGVTSQEELAEALNLRGWRKALLADLVWEMWTGQRAARCVRDEEGPHVAFERV